MPYNIEQADAQILGSSAHISYVLNFDRAAQHLVQVRMSIRNVDSPTTKVILPSWTPGSYKIRDYAGYQGNVEVFVTGSNGRKNAVANWTDKATLEIDTNGVTEIEVSYVVYGHERSVRTNHINRNHAFIVPAGVCMYVEGRTDETHHVVIERNTSEWPNVSTQLSPVKAGPGNSTFGALNYDILVDSPIEIGQQSVSTFRAVGADHELAIVCNQAVDHVWLVEHLKNIIEVEAKLFGGVPYDRYVFIIQAYPGVYGGLEHARSSVNAFDPSGFTDKKKAVEFLSLLCHEYFHLWNVKRIRPIELGPFDYTKENYTSMLWLAEGLTSYYDDHFVMRCGFLTEKEYIKQVAKDHLDKLHNVPGRSKLSVKDSSYLAWLKLYMQSPDANNRFPSYYLKGGVVFLMLDLHIIDHTDGKHTLDDGLRALWARYGENPSIGLTQDECIALLERGSGVQLRELLLNWLDGTEELPYSEKFATVGIEVSHSKLKKEAITFGENRSLGTVKSKVETGMNVAEVNGKVVVKSILDASPAQKAGIGIDDEIVSVNGLHISSVASLDVFLADAQSKPVQVTAVCDGRVYRTELTTTEPLTIELQDVKNMSDRQKTNRAAWLRKS